MDCVRRNPLLSSDARVVREFSKQRVFKCVYHRDRRMCSGGSHSICCVNTRSSVHLRSINRVHFFPKLIMTLSSPTGAAKESPKFLPRRAGREAMELLKVSVNFTRIRVFSKGLEKRRIYPRTILLAAQPISYQRRNAAASEHPIEAESTATDSEETFFGTGRAS